MNTTKQMTNAELENWKSLSLINKFFAAAPVEMFVMMTCLLASVLIIALEIAYQTGLIF